jgi:cytochrome c oxidase cbb3-type subunit 3
LGGIELRRYFVILGLLLAQQAPLGLRAAPQPPAAGRGGMRPAYPQRPPADPAAVERGKGLFTVNCGFCHGVDARGGESGPNLIRSGLVLQDQKGELIAPVVQKGRPDGGMPAFNLTAAQISDIAAYVHSFRVGGRDVARDAPPSIVVGNATAGVAVFERKCASCHSVTGDLKGIASRISDPTALQQTWIMPGGRGGPGRGAPPVKVSPTTVTITLHSGEKVEGQLKRIDDFTVSLFDRAGNLRTFERVGDTPKVELHDPLDPHRKLLAEYTDQDIHDLTAYLVTLK